MAAFPPTGERILIHPALSCPNAAPEEVDGAVRPPFLHRERGLVSKARSLSHYSGEPSWKKADYSNLDRRPDRMPVYGPGSKCLGRAEKETEWLRFHAPQTPGNSHCAPTPFRTFLLLELHDCRFRPRDLYPIGSNLEGFDITFFPDCPRTSRCGRGRKGRD